MVQGSNLEDLVPQTYNEYEVEYMFNKKLASQEGYHFIHRSERTSSFSNLYKYSICS